MSSESPPPSHQHPNPAERSGIARRSSSVAESLRRTIPLVMLSGIRYNYLPLDIRKAAKFRFLLPAAFRLGSLLVLGLVDLPRATLRVELKRLKTESRALAMPPG